MKLLELLSGLEYKTEGLRDSEINGIAYSKENIKDGYLFILIKRVYEQRATVDLDGCNPSAIICEEDAEIKNCEQPKIFVKNARSALSFVYSNYYSLDYGKLKIIGVTGTNGKTTTATLIQKILEADGYKVGFIGTGLISIGSEIISDENYSMTTPDPDKLYAVLRAMTDLGCSYAVMEISSHALALGKVAPIRFNRAVFTNISSEHMDFHNSLDDYFKTKALLFENAEAAIINVDDYHGRLLYDNCKAKKHSIGIIYDADARATEIESLGLLGNKFLYRGDNFLSAVKINLPGAFNIYNSLLAMCCAVSMGIKPCTAKRALSEIREINGRLNIINAEITVIIDYAHTSRATEECLRFLSGIKKNGEKLIAVFGCGGERDRSKRPKMAECVEKYADRIIITSDNSRSENQSVITADIISGFRLGAHYEIINDRKSAIITAIAEASPHDLVVILGKGPEKYNIDADGYHFFDERKIVLSALNERKKLRKEYANQA